MGRRSGLALLAAGLALACAQRADEPASAPRPVASEPGTALPTRLVVVSVAGLTPARYRDPGGGAVEMPNLAKLARSGVAADAVRTVAPASPYPAHATLLSGRRPAGHGVVADRRLGDRGVEGARYSEASLLRAPTLWSEATERGLRVATLAWPSTVGAELRWNLPDLEPRREEETWLGVLRGKATPQLLEWAEELGGSAPETRTLGTARDRVLTDLACRLLEQPQPPQLMLLHLSQTAVPLIASGPTAPATRAAFTAADAAIGSLVTCARRTGHLPGLALVVVGDHGVVPVHSALVPNAALAHAGLLTVGRRSTQVLSWKAIVRSNGGSAFVYARDERDARLARRALVDAAERTGAFRVVSADEMLSLGADPDAWFGLAAEPGFVFSDEAGASLMRAALARAGWGYLPEQLGMDAGFVAWGAGFARGVQVPTMRQTDVAPTLGRLLGVQLEGAEGRVLVGVLRLPRVSAVPAEVGP